jgi:hypothetical protein
MDSLMKRPITFTIVGVGVALLLAITNPNQNEYTVWAKQEVINQAGGGALTTGLMNLFGGPLINSATTERNFILFSLYTTHIDSEDSVTVLGILHHFIPLQGPRGFRKSST